MDKKRISVFGIGYVGLSLSLLLAKYHSVIAIDIDESKVANLNKGISPIKDKELENSLTTDALNFKASVHFEDAFPADFIIISIPTNFDESTNCFDTGLLEKLVHKINATQPKVPIIIKSTVPVGFTASLGSQSDDLNLIFSPEFLREGSALIDNLYPSRIIVSDNSKDSSSFAKILLDASKLRSESSRVLFMPPSEAEAVKLFSNTYLASRIAFFNELDTFSCLNGLNTEKIIQGISMDERIGNYYNNPSFGYGGYCLPKDSKQLLEQFENVPNKLIKAVVASNSTRIEFIISALLDLNLNRYGIYRINAKINSDNFRESVILKIAEALKRSGKDLRIYEPLCDSDSHCGIMIDNNLSSFKEFSQIIVTNRLSSDLDDVRNKVFSRDIFNAD